MTGGVAESPDFMQRCHELQTCRMCCYHSTTGLTLQALLTEADSRRLSRGHRSGGQLSSSELAGPPTADARPFCASFSTSASYRRSQP